MSLRLFVARDGLGEQERHKLTRSSPIGPAEHDEGGSLVWNIRQKEFRCERSLVKDMVSFSARRLWALRSLPKRHRIYSPAKVCQLFVDALQSHCEQDMW